MSNTEILSMESMLKGFNYNGENLFTFQAWKARGYTVKKGEKAFLQTTLWKSITKKNKEGKEESRIIPVKSSLFTIDQVQKLN